LPTAFGGGVNGCQQVDGRQDLIMNYNYRLRSAFHVFHIHAASDQDHSYGIS
jgi:hypothetical protein